MPHRSVAQTLVPRRGTPAMAMVELETHRWSEPIIDLDNRYLDNIWNRSIDLLMD